MKEILAAFATEIFRPIVTLLIPGFWATSLFLVALFMRHPVSWRFANEHKNGSSLVYLVIATAAGLILENIGGRFENHFFRKLSDQDKKNWYRYLRLAPETEPI